MQLIAIHLITLHNILEYVQIAIIQPEAADIWPRLYVLSVDRAVVDEFLID